MSGERTVICEFNLLKSEDRRTRLGYQTSKTTLNDYKDGMATIQRMIDSGQIKPCLDSVPAEGDNTGLYKCFVRIKYVEAQDRSPVVIDSLEDADGNTVSFEPTTKAAEAEADIPS